MSVLSKLEPNSVFEYFEKLASIPRGSGNMSGIAHFCVEFANAHSLKCVRDAANNVIIYKNATEGYEQSAPIILQGHLDMVCQKVRGSNFDFEADGLELLVDGDFIKARGTTLGADNGIAVAMVLSILASDNIPHPAIEAVFTTDEEVGMVGALQLDGKLLSAKKMINLDSEDEDCMTVSCAGGSDFKAVLPLERVTALGTEVTVTLKGLKGGHSGICINKGRVNADILAARVLDYLLKRIDFDIISADGGDKGNAIANSVCIRLCTGDTQRLTAQLEECLCVIKNEISAREGEFSWEISVGSNAEHSVFSAKNKRDFIYLLLCVPNGVMEMSAEIDGLVETSLNLGILKTQECGVVFGHALRSNKKSALEFLEDRLCTFFAAKGCRIETGGHYPPWEFNANSALQKTYIDCYKKQFDAEPRVEAIHAGLECGVFADKIDGFDAIAIGPQMYDVHTVSERLSISSTAQIYKLLLEIIKNCK